ncbi:hypothetical protein K431DRAFT_44343 [Polychaeton citri CBS 116435]|uniref:Uncharacterized protein n=1 Tax=Polychaeton citri CBS 116435 TaxID=1314669 RepID=A0A9P4Q8A5_9PEZI|nr:hypothetical protein K431DRAFT_44343 [Polychaeton citri CBS 116435]
MEADLDKHMKFFNEKETIRSRVGEPHTLAASPPVYSSLALGKKSLDLEKHLDDDAASVDRFERTLRNSFKKRLLEAFYDTLAFGRFTDTVLLPEIRNLMFMVMIQELKTQTVTTNDFMAEGNEQMKGITFTTGTAHKVVLQETPKVFVVSRVTDTIGELFWRFAVAMSASRLCISLSNEELLKTNCSLQALDEAAMNTLRILFTSEDTISVNPKFFELHTYLANFQLLQIRSCSLKPRCWYSTFHKSIDMLEDLVELQKVIASRAYDNGEHPLLPPSPPTNPPISVANSLSGPGTT